VEVPAVVRGSRVPAEVAGRVPATEGRSSTVQEELTQGKREREGSPKSEKYESGRLKQGHSSSNVDRTDRATQERVQYQRAVPSGQLLDL